MSSADVPTELTQNVAQLTLSETTQTTPQTEEGEGGDQQIEAVAVDTPEPPAAVTTTAKKTPATAGKKPAAKNQKKTTTSTTTTTTEAQTASTIPEPNSLEGLHPTAHISRGLGKKPTDVVELAYIDADGKICTQTSPPTVPVLRFYAQACPTGEFQDYTAPDHTYRTTSEECRENDLLRAEQVKSLREGAEVHRAVRADIQKYLIPGVKLIDIAQQLEKSTLDLVSSSGTFERTRGFPTGLSLNHVAAHFTPNPGDKTVLKQEDVLKVDFGVCIDGNIIDCAWTTHFEERYDPLVEAVKAATEAGIQAAGIDVRLGDVGGAIQEVMESYEITIDGNTLPIKSIKNLCGHSIGKYKIHAGHSIPSYNNKDQTKMSEGVLYAVETFGTNDPLAKIRVEGECSHYMLNYDVKKLHPRTPAPAVKLWNLINKRFTTLAFCRRWLVEEGVSNHTLQLYQLSQIGALDPYPPLVVRRGYQTAQFEHTILLGSMKKEILTRSWDY